MDIDTFLRASFRPRGLWLEGDVPEELSSISHLFDDLRQIFKTKSVPVDDLVLIQTLQGEGTALVRSKKSIITFDVQQLSYCSQIAELISFGEIDQEATFSFFHRMWSDAHIGVDMYGKIAEQEARLRFSIEADADVVAKMRLSDLMRPYSELSGVHLFFEAVACFMIGHEVGHYVFSTMPDEAKSDFSDAIRKGFPTRTKSTYLDNYFLEAKSQEIEGWQLEEMYCDAYAFALVEKICIDLNNIPAPAVSLAMSFLFASIFMHANDDLSDAELALLQRRSMHIQRWCLSSVEENDAVRSQTQNARVSDRLVGESSAVAPNFAIVQSLQDTYIKNAAVNFVRLGLIREPDERSAIRLKSCIEPAALDSAVAGSFSECEGTASDKLLSAFCYFSKGRNWYER